MSVETTSRAIGTSPPAQPFADVPPNEKRALLGRLLRQKANETQTLHPLSDNQQGIWFLYRFAPESSIYNVSFAGHIHASMDVPAFRRALQALVDRHPSLRTTFVVHADKPVQQIHEHQPVHFVEIDASSWRADELHTRLIEETQRPFDLERGPVMRVTLFSHSAQEHILLLVVHHIVVDFWSLAVILNDLDELYQAEQAGRPAILPPLDMQYTDFVRWQSNMLAGPAGERLWDYWKKQLALPLPVLNLPTDRPRPPIQMFRGAHYDFTLNEELTKQLKALAKAEGATLFMVLLAAYELMLHYHSGQEDILVASPMVGRSCAEFERLVGFFANPVVLRADLSGNPTFGAFLRQVRQTVLEALDHQDYPTLRLVERLRPPRDLSRSPLCQTMFVLDRPHRIAEAADPAFATDEHGMRMKLGGLVMESIPLERRAATLDLVMLIIETTGSLSVSIRFNTDLFDDATIARMADHFHTLLRNVVRNPATAIGDLEILSRAERKQLLVAFNDITSDFPRDVCVHQLFEEQVWRMPDNVAVMFEGQQLTYAELNARANQLAHHLQALGVKPEMPVAICMERSLELVVGLLGILKSGGAYVPLDPAHPKERLAFMLEDAHASIVLTRGPVERAPDSGIRTVSLDADREDIAAESEANLASGASAANLAYILYTSGSTGKPKGVMVEHRGLCNTINWLTHTLELSPADRCLLKTPITFDAAGREFFPILLTGGTLVIAEPGGHRDSRYLAETIRNERISIFHCVPSLLQFLVEEPAFDNTLSLRAVMCGGEVLPTQLVTRFQRRLGAKLYNVYGPTETIIDSTCWLCEGDNGRSSSPIGRPIPNARAYILDDALRPLPIGVTGQLHIGGVSLARGYLDRPELTAKKFIRDPFSAEPGARLYRTGDLTRFLPDGNIEFLGRADHQVKIRGFRIELGEIEAALRQHPAVREAAVLAREDAPGERRLVAYVVTDSTSDELRRHLKDKLPEFMVPSIFVPLDALPLLSNGKLDRRALPAPDRARPELDKTFQEPRTPIEGLLAETWAQLLGIERVGIHDNFFELGGHSLLATQLVSRVREMFQVEISLRRLFEAPTVAGLAESIEAARRAGQKLSAPPILPVPRDGHLELSFAQQRLWFFDQLEPGLSVYNIPAAIRLKGPFNLAALEKSLNEVVKRHESLRTTFGNEGGFPTQVIAPSLAIKLPVIDLRKYPAGERESEVRRMVTAEAQLPFDLSRGPLLRCTVLQVDDEEHVGLLTMHHIIADGWSMGLLIREVTTLYVALSAGGSAAPLPALGIQYADFSHWQRQWLQGEVLEHQLAYWKERLAGAPAAIDLPIDHPRPAVQTFRGAHKPLVLPKSLQESLKILGRREGVTQFMMLLAAFEVLLFRYSGQDDLIVGTPVANRNRIETEGLIGLFVNTLVLRTDLSGDPSFRELVQRVRDTCLGAYTHQDLPFDRLVEEVRAKRDLSRNPLFQVMFELTNTSRRTIELPGLTLNPVESDSEAAHFDLILRIMDTEEGLSAALVYNTDLFEGDTVVRMLGNFQSLLEAIVANPEQRLSELPLLTDAERRQILVEWNGAKTDDPSELCVHQLFEAQVARTPDAVAIVFGDEQLTYRELNHRANQLAHHLRSLSVGPEVLVAISLERSLEMVIGLLGILKAGGAYVPLDPAQPKERLAFMLKDTQAPVLLTRAALVAGLPEQDAKIIRQDSDWETIAHQSGENPACSANPEDLAYVIYTSGSTGRPKGVLVSHSAIAGHCRTVQGYYALTSRDAVLQFASPSFDVSLEEILPTLIAGARLVIMGADVWHPAEFHLKISEFGLTVLNLPTAYWQELAREWADTGLVWTIQPRLFVVGGDTMLPESLKLWQRTPLSAIRLVNAYGPTEATITATAYDVSTLPGDEAAYSRVAIGRPLANRAIYILDKHGNPVPIGVRGHLHIGGMGLARGYLNRPDLTAEKFIPDSFSNVPGARLYKTGDLARYRSDGNIEFLGRVDQQVKIRGFRIEPGEIEAALGRHPAVRAVAVVAREEAPGEKRLVAYVVTRSTIDELRRHLKNELPDYMVPAVFVLLDALPLMVNGKIDVQALPAPDQLRPELEKAFVAPRDDLERQLARIWEDVLDVHPVGVRDNFFELGGHSILAVRLFALIEQRLGKKLPLAAVFQGATIEHLAGILRQQATPGRPSSLVAIQPEGSRPPLFLVHPAGGHVFPYVHLARHLGRDQPCYGLQAHGLDDGQSPHERIEDMAACYIRAVQSVQPTGPYLLGGWSMGGVVAFEMAQQLHAQGQRVALLALLDGRIPTSDETFPEEDSEALPLIERYFGVSFGSMETLAELAQDQQLAFVLGRAKSAGLVPAELDISQARHFIEILRSNLRATQNYGLRVYPGRVTFFKARETLDGSALDRTMGWSEWASGGVDVHVVPGNHANLMYEPHVEVLAKELTTCIERALSAEEREQRERTITDSRDHI